MSIGGHKGVEGGFFQADACPAGLSLSLCHRLWPNAHVDTKPREKRRWPKVAMASGWLLILVAAALAFLWFYLLTPLRHRSDHHWMAEHSALGRWNEEQRMYLRTGASPDLMFRPDKIQFYGNKAWFEWLLKRVNSDASDFRVCGCTFSCLAYMSNHDFDLESGWNHWYAANKDKTQEQWLQAGFVVHNVKVTLPPSPSDAEALLSLLGKIFEGPPRPGYRLRNDYVAPSYTRYNAFRWLRDMGFSPVAYLIDHEAAKLRPEIISGIRQYEVLERRFPASDGVGILAFGPQPQNPLDDVPPRTTLTTAVAFTLYGLMAGFGVGGILLVRRGFRTLRLKSTPASRTSHPPGTADGPTDR